jgi:hypothetical protein
LMTGMRKARSSPIVAVRGRQSKTNISLSYKAKIRIQWSWWLGAMTQRRDMRKKALVQLLLVGYLDSRIHKIQLAFVLLQVQQRSKMTSLCWANSFPLKMTQRASRLSENS